MLQNATPLRKSAPGPPNISDEHVFCTAPATENAFCQILFKCPTPAIVLGNSTKPSPNPSVFYTFDFEMCFAPQRRALFDIATSKSGPRLVCFVHFDLEMCFATAACTFSSSQLPKVVRTWRALCILTSKFASRHNGVHFFNITNSKNGPTLVCFVHFDLEMCFGPLRRAIFYLSSGQLAPHPL